MDLDFNKGLVSYNGTEQRHYVEAPTAVEFQVSVDFLRRALDFEIDESAEKEIFDWSVNGASRPLNRNLPSEERNLICRLKRRQARIEKTVSLFREGVGAILPSPQSVRKIELLKIEMMPKYNQNFETLDSILQYKKHSPMAVEFYSWSEFDVLHALSMLDHSQRMTTSAILNSLAGESSISEIARGTGYSRQNIHQYCKRFEKFVSAINEAYKYLSEQQSDTHKVCFLF